ncbi:MAG: TPR domain protein [Candidatus Ozemobacter sibiricus]|uniref:TPR domain protein n=1 Tax=Candidatus Ozemobacter sibiricus TaxID=2268124 RepID=A0A367ZRM6_9BACT|nr:MAG: TPR domain protein [Candidatus Ozemobacter sibiricus]
MSWPAKGLAFAPKNALSSRSKTGPPSWSGRAWQLAKLAAGLWLILWLIRPGAAFGQVDHAAAARQAGCGTCHLTPVRSPDSATSPGATAFDWGEPPAPVARPRVNASGTPVPIRPGAGGWCLACHPDEARACHPIGVPASAGAGLPLEGGDGLSCLTCHSPHQAATASAPWLPPSLDRRTATGEHRTFLLTRPNVDGGLCRSCHAERPTGPGQAGLPLSVHGARAFESRSYAGSKACMACHAKIYQEWSRTPHARMTRPLAEVEEVRHLRDEDLEWPVANVRYVLGSHYVHRFVAEATGTLVVLPRIWDRHTRTWLSTRDHGWTRRSWIPQCAGCHTTGFSAETERFVEAGVGCEACHGPALNHVRTGARAFVRNPARFTPERREQVCMSCHTSGLDNTGRYHFPVGYLPGDDLAAFYSGLTPKPGQDERTFVGDESMEDRVRQWEFLKSRLFLAKGLTCDYCQNFRNFKVATDSEYLTHDQYCLTCHTDRDQHPAESPGQNCTRCHVPMRTPTGEYSIHDHKFRF